MNQCEREEYARFVNRACNQYGLNFEEIRSLQRDAKRLHRWAEAECNGEIQRDEVTGKPFRYYGQDGPGPIRKYPTADRETPAIKRIEAIAKAHGLRVELQGDPRGWPVSLHNGSEAYGLAVMI